MIVNVEDARRLARRRLPKIFFDYIDGGAFSETTLAASTADFGRWRLEQRVLVDVAARDLSTTFAGARHGLPFMLGPVGFLGLYAGRGEILAAEAAHATGTGLCLSSFSIAPIGAVRAATGGPLSFQLYVMKDRGLSDHFLSQAEAAGVDTLFLTVDTAITSVRERDVRNGFRALTRVTPGLAVRLATRPRWCLDMWRAGAPAIGHVAGRPGFEGNILAQAAAVSRQIDPGLAWKDAQWLRERWKGRVIIKGVLSAEDTRAARDLGADGIVVSNHGGRQLDGAPSTISMLPEIVAAADGAIEVLFDGGVRRGADIVKALALGASGVLLGRAYAFGLAAGGRAGVAAVISALATEVELSLALMGLASVDALKAKGVAALRPAE